MRDIHDMIKFLSFGRLCLLNGVVLTITVLNPPFQTHSPFSKRFLFLLELLIIHKFCVLISISIGKQGENNFPSHFDTPR